MYVFKSSNQYCISKSWDYNGMVNKWLVLNFIHVVFFINQVFMV